MTRSYDSVNDYCYNCGHQLGEHRQSGRCQYIISKVDLLFCGCQQYSIKEQDT